MPDYRQVSKLKLDTGSIALSQDIYISYGSYNVDIMPDDPTQRDYKAQTFSLSLRNFAQKIINAANGLIKLCTFSNGAYFYIVKTNTYTDSYGTVIGYTEVGLKTAEDVTIINSSTNSTMYITGFRNSEYYTVNYILPVWFMDDRLYCTLISVPGRDQYNQNRIYYTNIYAVTDCTATMGANVGIVYNWKSWPQLSGNNGMFLMNLSTIADSLIGDGETPFETFDPTGINLEIQTELYYLVQNLLNGQETTIAYCGDNYLTATRRTTFTNNVTTVYVILKFYFRSDVLIYTSPELTVYSTASGISKDYLCLIFDDDSEVAATDIIQYWADTGKLGINEYTLPSDEQMRALYIWLQDNGQEREQISPYDTGTIDNGGDPGTPTPQDHITDSPLPTLGGLDLGVVTLYLPTTEQLQSIAAFLWSDNVLDNFKKYFNNFADNLLSLYVLPFTPSGLNTKTFKVGNMVSQITDVAFCTTRYIDRDMGTFNLEKLWDSYLDFSPYTRVELYLPYLGLHSLDTDELMCPAKMDGTLQRGLGSVLNISYRLDLLTGVIVAKVKVNGEIRYQYEGRVGLTIPLTGQTYAQMAQAIVQAGAGVATTIASGGLTAPLTAAAAVTGTVNASKPNVERIGNISGDASMLATNVPYLIVTRPNKPLLDEQEIYTGFPSYKSGTLGSFSGFTQVIEAHVEGISCTEEERTLILKWLKEGIII